MTDDLRVPTFLASMGASVFCIARNLTAPRVPKNLTYTQLKNLLEGHLKPTPLIIAERFKFHRRDQKPQECVSDYVLALIELTATCDFGNFWSKSCVIDWFVAYEERSHKRNSWLRKILHGKRHRALRWRWRWPRMKPEVSLLVWVLLARQQM